MNVALRITRAMLRYRLLVIAVYTATLAATTAQLLLPRFLGSAIDKLSQATGENGLDEGAILTIAIWLVALSVLRGVFSYGQTYLGEVISQRVAYDLRNAFYNRVQNQSFSFHDRHHTGNLMSRAVTDVENVRFFIFMGLLRAPFFLIQFVAVAVILLVLDWRLGLLSVLLMPIVISLSLRMRAQMRALWQRIQEHMADLSTVLQENLTGVRVIRAFGAEKHEEAKFDVVNREVVADNVRATGLRTQSIAVTVFGFMVTMVAIIGYGGYLVVRGEMTPGELAQFIFFMQILMMPVRMVGWIINTIARGLAAGQRMYEILDAPSAVTQKRGAIDIGRFRGHVRFESVSFGYDPDSRALSSIDLDVRPGQVIALMGAPGSGKSTLVSLIPRFYDVSSGRVTIDGTDIREASLDSLRRNIGIVQQDIFLFSATLGENIAYGRMDATLDEVQEAARLARLGDFIGGLKEGLSTPVAERGASLSGGQRQRVAIARTLLLDPPLLILDDSTSSVDTETEEHLQHALETVMKGRTTFVIAHRLSTVHRADLIVVLDKGLIVERGTHAELLATNGAYRRIYDLQLRPRDGASSAPPPGGHGGLGTGLLGGRPVPGGLEPTPQVEEPPPPDGVEPGKLGGAPA
jgi:ABC-type multidrug transport system fused ATPase/permease subunit